MPMSTYEMSYQEREANSQRWLIIFVLLSILAHLVVFVILALANQFIPQPKLRVPPTPAPATTLTLQQAPATPKPHKAFMQTDPDLLAKPDPNAPFESDNNTRLKSTSTTARDPNSVTPDVVDKKTTPFLKNRPNAPTKDPDHPAPPPSPKSQPAQPKSPTPPQPKEAKPTPPPPKPEKAPPKPNPKPSENTIDPVTGLPVLPPLDAPTVAPQSATPDSVANPISNSLPQQQTSSHGALGAHGDTSIAANSTEFGRYKAMVYRKVGGNWYPKVNAYFQTMPVGLVHVQFTIHSDGRVETKILGDSNNPILQQLLSISVLSIQEGAPYEPFSDKLKQEIIAQQGGDGESYTDDFTFSVYGG